TTAAFHSLAVPRSSSGEPTLTPSLAKVSSASLIANAVCTHAFVGMQPTRRQVPPSSSSFSMQTVFAPSCAARMAAVYPPGPPPRTATSHSISLSRKSLARAILQMRCLRPVRPAPGRIERVVVEQVRPEHPAGEAADAEEDGAAVEGEQRVLGKQPPAPRPETVARRDPLAEVGGAENPP